MSEPVVYLILALIWSQACRSKAAWRVASPERSARRAPLQDNSSARDHVDALSSEVGLLSWSAYHMAWRGQGTPFARDVPNYLVVDGSTRTSGIPGSSVASSSASA
jgi:hypothetical protein